MTRRNTRHAPARLATGGCVAPVLTMIPALLLLAVVLRRLAT